MNKEIKIILTSEDYFDIIGFDDQPPKEQIAYILYYVTKIAKLRKDMIPEIISDRIEDQYKLYLKRTHTKEGETYRGLTRDKVRDLMQNTKEYFEESLYGLVDKSDRKETDVAYVLTKKKYKELDREFEKKIKNKIHRVTKARIYEGFYIGVTFVFLILLLCFCFTGLLGIYIEKKNGGEYIIGEISLKGFTTLFGIVIGLWGSGYAFGKNMNIFNE